MGDPIWNKIGARLLQGFSLPHNALEFRRNGSSPELAAKKKLEEIRSGLAGVPKEDLHNNLEAAYSRIYFHATDRKAAIRDMLRELLAISKEWNAMTEIWALELPAGEKLAGFSGIGTPQRLYGNLSLTEKGNRLLVGKARQIFFPMKNPLWVKQYRNLAS